MIPILLVGLFLLLCLRAATASTWITLCGSAAAAFLTVIIIIALLLAPEKKP